MTNDDKDLKPCPFCGKKEFTIYTDCEGMGVIIQCDNLECHAGIWIDHDDLPDLKEEDFESGEISIHAEGLQPLFKIWNTRSTPQQPNGYDMDGNPIQYGLSGGSQQPSEPLKELDEKAILMVLDQCCPVSMDKMAKEMIAQILWNKFGQPSEKKALSRDGITDIIRIDLRDKMKKGKLGLVGYTRTELAEELSQAIHSALPAQREVRYPDTAYVDKNDGKPGRIEKINYCLGWNHCIDEFKKLNGG